MHRLPLKRQLRIEKQKPLLPEWLPGRRGKKVHLFLPYSQTINQKKERKSAPFFNHLSLYSIHKARHARPMPSIPDACSPPSLPINESTAAATPIARPTAFKTVCNISPPFFICRSRRSRSPFAFISSSTETPNSSANLGSKLISGHDKRYHILKDIGVIQSILPMKR